MRLLLLGPEGGGWPPVRKEWWMRALQYRTYGGPEVLEWAEALTRKRALGSSGSRYGRPA